MCIDHALQLAYGLELLFWFKLADNLHIMTQKGNGKSVNKIHFEMIYNEG